MTTITISLPKKEQARLNNLAIRYGLSLPEFTTRVLSELSNGISEETFEEYSNPRQVKSSLARAIKDFKAGRISESL